MWIDRQCLPGSEEVFHSPHGLAGQPIVGTFVYVGQAVSVETIQKARSVFVPNSRLPNSDSLIGVTRLEHGFLCRYRGSSTTEVRNWFTNVWQLVRMSLLNRASCLPRVWMV